MSLNETVDNLVYKTRNSLIVIGVLLGLAGGTIGMRDISYDGLKKAGIAFGIATISNLTPFAIFYGYMGFARKQTYTQNYKERQTAENGSL